MEQNSKTSKYLIIDKKHYFQYMAGVFILPVFDILMGLKGSIELGKNPFDYSPFSGSFVTLILMTVLLVSPVVQSMMTKKKIIKNIEKDIF